MTIKTKFSIGQECWVVHDNKAQQMQVVGIFINVLNGCNNEISYSLDNSSSMHRDADLFESKEALLQSL